MIKKLLLILCLITSSISYAQNNLPPCSGNFLGPCFGLRNYSNGDNYLGQHKDNYRNGQGTYTWASGEKYVGQYRDDKRNGQGTTIFANGEKYEGQWKDDKRNGQGANTWPGVGKYVGQYVDDKRNGFGTYYNANGSINQQGLWSNDKFVQAQTPLTVTPPVVPKGPVKNAQDINAQDIKRQKCIRLGLVPGSADFQQCIN
jgi:hypothetical protein